MDNMDKMTTCKTCGAKIAKSAKRCPYCGSYILTGSVFCNLVLIGIIVAIIVTSIDRLSGDSRAAKSAALADASASSSPAAITVYAADLWQAYSDNEVNADNLYKDKIVAVTGAITDIGKDTLTGNPCISLESGSPYSLYPIQCFFTSSDKNSQVIAALKNGQVVTIYGKCVGTPISNVQVSNCYLPG